MMKKKRTDNSCSWKAAHATTVVQFHPHCPQAPRKGSSSPTPQVSRTVGREEEKDKREAGIC